MADITQEDLYALLHKIDYEGGLSDYLFFYANYEAFKNCGEEVYAKAKEAYEAFEDFENAFDELLNDKDVEL